MVSLLDLYTWFLFGLASAIGEFDTDAERETHAVLAWVPVLSICVVVFGPKILRSVGHESNDFAIALTGAVLLAALPYAVAGDPAGNFGPLF